MAVSQLLLLHFAGRYAEWRNILVLRWMWRISECSAWLHDEKWKMDLYAMPLDE